jgi:hypothetical protein
MTRSEFDFEIFLGSSDINHGSLLYNTTYTGPPCLKYIFQVVQTQTTAAYCTILATYTGPPSLILLTVV